MVEEQRSDRRMIKESKRVVSLNALAHVNDARYHHYHLP